MNERSFSIRSYNEGGREKQALFELIYFELSENFVSIIYRFIQNIDTYTHLLPRFIFWINLQYTTLKHVRMAEVQQLC